MAPGLAERLLQPKSSAPRLKQGTSERLLQGNPFTGSLAGSFLMRNSTGSMPSLIASSSIALSKPKKPGASAGARWKPGVFTSVATVASRMQMFGD